jgi:MYXO-CTERM domain-containing protein
MKHWVVSLVGLGLTLVAGTAAAALPALSHSEPAAIAEPLFELGRARGATVAASGSGFLAVYSASSHGPLRGRLLGEDGVPLGPPFLISAETKSGRGAAVVFDGSHFVVTWLEQLEEREELWLQRMTTQGEKLGELARVELGEMTHEPEFSVMRGASGVVVMACTAELEADNSCRTWLVSDDAVTPADERTIPNAALEMDLEASGGELLAAVTLAVTGMVLIRADADGALSEALPMTANLVRHPNVVATDDGWAILWLEDEHTRLGTFDFEGNLTAAPAPLIAANVPMWQRAYTLPNGFLVFSRELDRSCGFCPDRHMLRKFSVDWTPLGEPSGQQLPRYFTGGALSASGSQMLTLWQDGIGTVSLLQDPNDFVMAEPATPVSVVPVPQYYARSAPGPGGWLVAWVEPPSVRARLLDEGGLPASEPFTIGSEAVSEEPTILAEVSGRPDGWLVIWGKAAALRASVLDSQAKPWHQVEVELSGERFQALPTRDGWTLALNQFVPGQGMAVATRELGIDGSLSEPRFWSTFSTLNQRAPFDITASGDGYRIWWAADGTLVAKDVSGAVVRDVALPSFEASDFSGLSAAQGSALSALAWASPAMLHLATTAGPTTRSIPGRFATELTTLGDLALMGCWSEQPGLPSGRTELHSADAESDGSALDSIDNTRLPALSQARDNKVLLTFARDHGFVGSTTERVHVTVVTMTERAQGGQGGESGADAGGAAGIDAGGAAGADAGGGAGESSGTGPQSGGGVAGDGQAGEASEADASPPKTSRGCGCRAVGGAEQHGSPYLLLAVGLLALRRRR